jgi:hypothetical protein
MHLFFAPLEIMGDYSILSEFSKIVEIKRKSQNYLEKN